MKILAVAAETLELAPWLKRCGAIETLNWPLAFARKAKWGAETLYAVANGAGPRLAAQAVEAAVRAAGPFDRFLSVGLCGALDPALPLRAVCTANEVSDGESRWPAAALPGAVAQRLLSIDTFLRAPEEKLRWAARGFGIVEMEAAAVARYAAEHGAPFHAAKVVSDCAGEHFALDFNQHRDADGRFSRGRIALAAVRHPIRYAPDLIRMASRGPAASETLGVFLAKFRF
jgi:adenosylhomocysteine nucleosidase